jgi:hypothetical protein
MKEKKLTDDDDASRRDFFKVGGERAWRHN